MLQCVHYIVCHRLLRIFVLLSALSNNSKHLVIKKCSISSSPSKNLIPLFPTAPPQMSETPDTSAEKKTESLKRINPICKTNGSIDSCNLCERLGTSRLYELLESKFPFVSRIEFIRSKLSNFSAHVSRITQHSLTAAVILSRPAGRGRGMTRVERSRTSADWCGTVSQVTHPHQIGRSRAHTTHATTQ